jgi:hypothetical protein
MKIFLILLYLYGFFANYAYFSILYSIEGRYYNSNANIWTVLLTIVPYVNVLHTIMLFMIGTPFDHRIEHRYTTRKRIVTIYDKFFGIRDHL